MPDLTLHLENVPPLIELAVIVVLGGAAQWLAWRLRLPSILLLLLFGFIAGPITLFLEPDELFGSLLRPFVSLSVAIILFEGGLSLNFSELRGTGGVVRNLVTLGMVGTWLSVAAAAHYIVGMSLPVSALLGAILVVTGPTVILPLLRHVRPIGHVASILKWEGIVIDPIGVLLTVLVFELVVNGDISTAPQLVAIGVAKTLIGGTAIGLAAAGMLVIALKRYWVPEYLQNIVTLMLLAAAFAGADMLQHESGLMAVTVMGVALANQRRVDVKHIVEFKENLRVILLSALFILLSARLRREDLVGVGPSAFAFVAAVIFVARPLCVWISTLGSKLKTSERLFLMWMAPRGIVAASVASVFAIDLEREGHAEARLLVPLTFLTIVSTVLLYGLTSGPLARFLKLSIANPQGLLILGAHTLGRQIAAAVQKAGFEVMLVDTNPTNASLARLEGIPVYMGNILGERTLDEINLSGIGRLLALTPNDSVNILAVKRFVPVFGKPSTFQLAPKLASHGKDQVERHLRGRLLSSGSASYAALAERIESGSVVKTTNLTESFNYKAFAARYGADMIPLFIIPEPGRIQIIDSETRIDPKPGSRIIAIVRAGKEEPTSLNTTSADVQ